MDRLITVCYLPVNLLFIASFIHFHEVVRSRPRILGGFGAFTLAVTAMPLLDMFIPAGNGSLAVMLLLVAVCGMADGACQGALFGEAATLDPRYTQALITGTAISGVVMSLLRILTKGLLPATPEGLRASASLYFLAAALLCISCIIVYTAVLPRLLRTKHQPRGVVYSATAFDSSNASEEGGQELQHSRPAALEPQQGGRQADDELAGLVAPGALLSSAGAGQSLTSGAPVSYLDVAWQVRGYAGSLVLVYVVTLSIFPGVLAEDVASEKLSSWYPVLLIAAFNVADAVGKWLPALPACRIRDARKIAVAAAARVVFIPAFYFAGKWKECWSLV